MAAGGLEATAQENRATEPSLATTGTGCNKNSEIPVEEIDDQLKEIQSGWMENLS